ncbi:unnamed protein product [Mesocestoides corti]|uniref:N-acetyltransferase domain-containing protein n=1 Tax=Mesocestoides corti TaxID=53468 RepID=A0A3P6HLC6_MESCO|nr:unnamed protein product [Mesocestoides corti]
MDTNFLLSFLKVGEKKLFLFNNYGEYFEVEPVCVLDFYIKEECQRKGYGRELFEDIQKIELILACLMKTLILFDEIY